MLFPATHAHTNDPQALIKDYIIQIKDFTLTEDGLYEFIELLELTQHKINEFYGKKFPGESNPDIHHSEINVKRLKLEIKIILQIAYSGTFNKLRKFHEKFIVKYGNLESSLWKKMGQSFNSWVQNPYLQTILVIIGAVLTTFFFSSGSNHDSFEDIKNDLSLEASDLVKHLHLLKTSEMMPSQQIQSQIKKLMKVMNQLIDLQKKFPFAHHNSPEYIKIENHLQEVLELIERGQVHFIRAELNEKLSIGKQQKRSAHLQNLLLLANKIMSEVGIFSFYTYPNRLQALTSKIDQLKYLQSEFFESEKRSREFLRISDYILECQNLIKSLPSLS